MIPISRKKKLTQLAIHHEESSTSLKISCGRNKIFFKKPLDPFEKVFNHFKNLLQFKKNNLFILIYTRETIYRE